MIPAELLASSRWMMAWGKVPLCVRTGKGFEGYQTNPDAWCSFEQLSKRVPRPTRTRGWGIVTGFPFIVIDLDDCVENGEPNARAQAIIKKFLPTYVELSPSKTGLHIWYRCRDHEKLPSQATGSFEIYSRRRFMTVTGDQVSESNEIREIGLADALAMFRLSNPKSLETIKKFSDEEGYWCEAALVALLEAWKAIPKFKCEILAGKYGVHCPGDGPGWRDGNAHSDKNPTITRDAMVWIENGWAVFHCFHAHCAEKTWKDFVEHHDPYGTYFNLDEWQEEQLRKLDGEE